MKADFVLPIHDTTGMMLASFERVLPLLESIASHIHVGITVATRAHCPDAVAQLEGRASIVVIPVLDAAPVGDQFLSLYRTAAETSDADRLLHLCFVDRLIFALDGTYRATFLKDMEAVQSAPKPVIFARSAQAWATHPANYRALEGFVTTLGELLFGLRLDFAWCHFAIRAGRLAGILNGIHQHDLSMMAELILAVRNDVVVQEVDWLAWEDPFILGRSPNALRLEREASLDETQKRLSYVVPMMQALVNAAGATGSSNISPFPAAPASTP